MILASAIESLNIGAIKPVVADATEAVVTSGSSHSGREGRAT